MIQLIIRGLLCAGKCRGEQQLKNGSQMKCVLRIEEELQLCEKDPILTAIQTNLRFQSNESCSRDHVLRSINAIEPLMLVGVERGADIIFSLDLVNNTTFKWPICANSVLWFFNLMFFKRDFNRNLQKGWNLNN